MTNVVGLHPIIAPAYHNYLLRDLDAAGLAYWANQMKNHGLTNENVITGFVACDEYFNNHQA